MFAPESVFYDRTGVRIFEDEASSLVYDPSTSVRMCYTLLIVSLSPPFKFSGTAGRDAHGPRLFRTLGLRYTLS